MKQLHYASMDSVNSHPKTLSTMGFHHLYVPLIWQHIFSLIFCGYRTVILRIYKCDRVAMTL